MRESNLNFLVNLHGKFKILSIIDKARNTKTLTDEELEFAKYLYETLLRILPADRQFLLIEKDIYREKSTLGMTKNPKIEPVRPRNLDHFIEKAKFLLQSELVVN